MDDPPIQAETTVTASYLASVPAVARRHLGIEPGDKLVWELHEGRLVVRVRKAKGRAFADFVPFDSGEPYDCVDEIDIAMAAYKDGPDTIR